MAPSDPFRQRTMSNAFSTGRASSPDLEEELKKQEEDEAPAAQAAESDPWTRRPEPEEEEAREEEERSGGDPWSTGLKSNSFFSSARPGGTQSGSSSGGGDIWAQPKREVPKEESGTSQSFAVKRYDPRTPKEKENPFASRDTPSYTRRGDNPFAPPKGR